MKNIVIYIIILMLLVFAIPLIFTNIPIQETSSKPDESVLDNSSYSTIKLYHTKDGTIEELNMNEYLYGVVAGEMPAIYELEALKAQAIVARTYTIYQIKNGSKHENADICDSSLCCQAWITKENRFARWEDGKQNEYWNKIVEAVSSTNKKYITYNGEPINAFFHSNSGGKTELASNVWGGSLPYLKIVETSGEESYSAYSSETIFSKDELIVKMRECYKDFEINFKELEPIKILNYTESGRVKNIRIGTKEISGVECRKIFGLKSSNFSVEINGDNIKFSVIGYGHGVGLSQSGSDVLAKQGFSAEEIIKYYFNNIEINECN